MRIVDKYVSESDSNRTYSARIELSAPATQDVFFSAALSGGTATEGSDFLPVVTGTGLIPAGRSSASVSFEVVGDTIAEPDESFAIDLSGVSGATLADGHADVTIFDNDGGVPQAVADNYIVATGGPTVVAATIGVLFNDTDPAGGSLTASLAGNPLHGSVVVAADGSLTYTPADGFSGVDAFVYQACSSHGACAKGVATLTVTGVGLDANYDRGLWRVPAASDPATQGFIRLSNISDGYETLMLFGIDSAGRLAPRTISLGLAAHASVQLNSHDLEFGNAAKGVVEAFGPGTGAWSVIVEANPDTTRIYGYVRTADGFLASAHDRVPGDGTDWYVPFFNPASNASQVSRLRIGNLASTPTDVLVDGIDDSGHASATASLALAALQSVELSAADLENGNTELGLTGALGHGTGKWRLHVAASAPAMVQSLLTDPNGYITNLSRLPEQIDSTPGQHVLWYLPRASNQQQQGFVRLSNKSDATGTVTLRGRDDAGNLSPGTVTLTIGPHQSRQLTSQDLETGNPAKATGQWGTGSGDWQVTVTSDQDIDAMSLIRTTTGFVSTVHDRVENSGVDGEYDVPLVNPGKNVNQLSLLRLFNPNATSLTATINGYDDSGASSPQGPVTVQIPGHATVELTAADLENGNAAKGMTGKLGTGTGKWRLHVSAFPYVWIVSLLRDPNGNLTNLSSDPDGDSALPGP